MTERIKFGTPEECEEATIVVCMRIGEGNAFRFDDNQFGRCADCGHAIYFRPYAPKTPPKVCVHCALDRAEIPEDEKQRLKEELKEQL